ncbi:MAG: PIN domain-containing protein [Gammaproteobacteria bacterium]|nr:PIN domain-containing protein [Gammaproteobacteria bacterium]
MAERRTDLDANVLIAAWNGDAETRAWARAVLDDPRRRLVVSDFVRLEVLPKPSFHGKPLELAFMQTLLASAETVPVSADLIQHALALALAGRFDLSPLDALHLAAAAVAGVDELVTLERPEKPICRQTEVRVISLCAQRDGSRP